MARKPVGATATKWYKILGHAGPNAIGQLPKHINGAELKDEAILYSASTYYIYKHSSALKSH